MHLDEFNIITDKYLSFFNSKGRRRIVAIKWANDNIARVVGTNEMSIKYNLLFQKTGWRTFVGLGFYSAVYSLIKKDIVAKNNIKLAQLADILLEIIESVLQYTDIGYLISLGNNIEESTDIDYARVDEMGNIFIYPSDAEMLISDYEEFSES